MNSLENQTLAQMVINRPYLADVFEKHDIDYSCRGYRTLFESLKDDPVQYEAVRTDLLITSSLHGDIVKHTDERRLKDIIDELLNVYHAYIREIGPVIENRMTMLSDKYGMQSPELELICSHVITLMRHLVVHIMKEEELLFPRILQMEEMTEEANLNYRIVADPLRAMIHEHDDAGLHMTEIRKLTNNYTAGKEYGVLLQVAYDELREFAVMLHRHMHIENNILFPKAKWMLASLQ